MESVEFAILDWIQQHLRCGFLDTVLPAVSWICNHGEVWIILAAVLLALTNWVKPTKNLHPIVFIAASAVVGVVFRFAGV